MFTAQVVDWQGKMLGRYRLLQLLGRGGMGEVWQAQDTELARQVAIKLLPPVLRQEEEYLRAFSNEARTIASLEHPHILAVHDFGEFQNGDEVITYLVMPLVNTTLRARIKQQDRTLLPIATSLGYLRQAARAIDYAHSKQILHRDIKPANLLLQDDWLFLTDFGIAKLLSTSTYRSRTHAGAGTPGYMAPEQIRGRSLPASDLYSLAIIAYQLLTGHMPFSGEEPYAIFLKHILHDPPPPRQFNARLPEVMERTLLRGLARQPEERHSSCQEFVTALELGWQESGANSIQPDISAAPDVSDASVPFDTDTTLPAPWNKRAAASLTAQRDGSPPTQDQSESTLSQYSAQPTLFDWHDWLEHQDEDGPAQENGPERKKTASPRSRRSFMLGAAALLVAGGGIALSSFYHPAISIAQKLSAGVPVLKLTGHTGDVTNIRWNPRGRYLVSAGSDARVLLWDIETLLASSNGKLLSTKQPVASYEPDENLSTHDLTWSPDGLSLALRTSKVAWSGYGDAIKVIDVCTPDARPALYYDVKMNQRTVGGEITVLAWSPQGNTIATAINNDLQVILWKVGQTNQITTILQDATLTVAQRLQRDSFVESLCWSQDGSWLVGLDIQLYLAIWNTATNTLQRIALPDRTKDLHTSAVAQVKQLIYNYTVVSSPTSPTLFAASDNDVIALYDVQKRTFTRLLGTDDATALQTRPIGDRSSYYAQITALAWSPAGRYLAGTYYSNSLIYLWDLRNSHPRLKNGVQMPDLIFGKNDHTDTIADLTWSPDERYLASSSRDGTIVIWKMDGA